MSVTRDLYLASYILYLATIALALWFLLHYTGVQPWVWIFFALAILIAIVGVLMKETVLRRKVTSEGVVISPNTSGWLIFYYILHIMAFILVVVGLGFVIGTSSIPWYVWVILGGAVLFSILSNIMGAGRGIILPAIFGVISLVLFVVGIILLVIYSNAPFWTWLIVIIAAIFAILAGIFESVSEREEVVKTTSPPATITLVRPTTTAIVLPASSLPEQTV